MCDGHAWMDIHMIGYCLELAKQHHKLSAIAQTHATIQKSIVLNKRQSFSEYDGYIIVFMSCVSSSGCRGSDASPPSAGESGRMRRHVAGYQKILPRKSADWQLRRLEVQ